MNMKRQLFCFKATQLFASQTGDDVADLELGVELAAGLQTETQVAALQVAAIRVCFGHCLKGSAAVECGAEKSPQEKLSLALAPSDHHETASSSP